MADLKQCPCRNSYKVWIIGPVLGYNEGFLVRCEDCKRETPIYLSKQQAINAWNEECRQRELCLSNNKENK